MCFRSDGKQILLALDRARLAVSSQAKLTYPLAGVSYVIYTYESRIDFFHQTLGKKGNKGISQNVS